MKKKILLSLLCGLFILGISTGCGNSKVTDNNGDNSNNEVENKEQVKEDTKSDNNTPLLTGTYQVPLQNIYIDTPAFHMIEAPYSNLYMVNDVKYVAFTCLYRENGSDSKSAMDTTFEVLKGNLFGYHQVNHLNDVEEKNVKVNGIDTYLIKGTVNCGTDNVYDAYVYGYSFVFEGYPCSIIGVVEDPEQKQEDIDNITEIVDAMMKTVRNEK